MTLLTEKEQAFANKVEREMRFYDQYKKFMSAVKRVYLKQGPEAAKQFIRKNVDFTLGLAIDELFSDLFTNL